MSGGQAHASARVDPARVADPATSRAGIASLFRTRPAGWMIAAIALIVCVSVDHRVYHLFHVGKEAVEGLAWYQLVRAVGTLWFWIPIALGVGLARGGAWRRRVRGALFIFFAALLAGVLAEGLKLVVGRERPLLHDGSYVFHPFGRWFNTVGLSFPSSHAAVAFGGAWMLWRLAQARSRAWTFAALLSLIVAAGCGLSRILTGAHFLGDVVGSGITGALAAAMAHRAIPPRLARRWPTLLLLRRRRTARRAQGPAQDAGTLAP